MRNKKQKSVGRLTISEAISQQGSRYRKVMLWTNIPKTVAIILAVTIGLGNVYYQTATQKIEPHIAVIGLSGPIETGNRETDGWELSKLIDELMIDDKVKALIIEANSPGGAPVDAEHVYQTIMKYRNAGDEAKPIYVAIRSICASACYYIASAADEIYSLKSSLVGSIGVRMDSFYIKDAADRIGIKRRTFQAGEHKTLLDPFVEMKDEEITFLQQNILDKLHQQFIDAVKAGRGERISSEPELYSGLVWTGMEAKELGLVDRIMTPSELGEMLKTRHSVTKLMRRGKKKIKLSNIFTMNVDVAVEMITNSVIDRLESKAIHRNSIRMD